MLLLDIVTHAGRSDALHRYSGSRRLAAARCIASLAISPRKGCWKCWPMAVMHSGLRLLDLASRSWARNEPWLIAEPHLNALQQLTGETVHSRRPARRSVIYLDKVEGSQPVRMYSQIGTPRRFIAPASARRRPRRAAGRSAGRGHRERVVPAFYGELR